MSPVTKSVLLTLTTRVLLLSEAQVARGWFRPETGERSARRCLSALEREGLVERTVVLAMPERRLEVPLYRWQADDAAPGGAAAAAPPDFGFLARMGRRRWQGVGLQAVTVWTATRTAARRYGAPFMGGVRRPSQASHDLTLSGLFVDHFLRSANDEEEEEPEERCSTSAVRMSSLLWTPEAFLKAQDAGDRIPDALLLMQQDGDNPAPYAALELAGASVRASRIEKLHRFCIKYAVPAWELW